MKKRSVVNLIKYHSEKNDIAFRDEAESIAKDFDREGDSEIAGYIMSLLSDKNVFFPQIEETTQSFFERVELKNDNLWLPDEITRDLLGIVNAVSFRNGINKFLFQGRPGTGKTEAVKQVARILKRDVFMVNFAGLVDSKLGNTAKNITDLFREINHFAHPQNLIILFDEIDAIALDRTNQQDHREMGRATSGLLREMDRMNDEIILIATTNLFKYFDKALIRRFDAVIDFDRYTDEDLLEIGKNLVDRYMKEFHLMNKDKKLFKKIYSKKTNEFSPGEIKNIIKTSVAFSNPEIEGDYLRRIYEAFCGKIPEQAKILQEMGFTVREIGVLTGRSKSSVDRELRESV